MQSMGLMAIAILVAGGGMVGCRSAPPGDGPAPAPGDAPAPCIVVEVQNMSLQGVTVWIEWDGAAPRRMGRLGLNARRVYRQRFRNNQLTVHFQRDAGSGRVASNPILPTPGSRLDIIFRENGPSPLRQTGVARC